MPLLQTQGQVLRQRPDPQMLQRNHLLQLPCVELQQRVFQEVAANPALESEQDLECGHCAIPGPQCTGCPYNPDPLWNERLRSQEWDRGDPELQPAWEEEYDPFGQIEAPASLADHLEWQLRAACNGQELRIGLYLIASLSAAGYLTCEVSEAARILDVSVSQAETALARVQELDPAGVGARSLQECLLLQTRAAAGERELPPLVLPLLTEHWATASALRWDELARSLKRSRSEIRSAMEWIRTQLHPFPGLQVTGTRSRAPQSARIVPDVVIVQDETQELRAEFPSDPARGLKVNSYYERIWRRMSQRPQDYSDQEREHVREHLVRAQQFLRSLQERGLMFRQVVDALLYEQEPFFRSEDEEHLRSLTQAQVAASLQVHESTVSRAVADKYL
ncbi:MAG: hypothetical protein FJX77_09740, partial [Armatimonadetes bacterium]|nr:hypothetical protein [Armatimonadota bacterium]